MTIQRLQSQLEEEERQREDLERDLEQRDRQIAGLQIELEEARNRQVEAIDNGALESATNLDERYRSLREVLLRSEEERRELRDTVNEHEARERGLRRELEAFEEQRTTETAVGRRLEIIEENIVRFGNLAAQMSGILERDGDTERTSPDPQNSEQEIRGPHQRQRRGGSGGPQITTIRDPRSSRPPTHVMSRRPTHVMSRHPTNVMSRRPTRGQSIIHS
jgi:chromosome segregation ATPase